MYKLYKIFIGYIKEIFKNGGVLSCWTVNEIIWKCRLTFHSHKYPNFSLQFILCKNLYTPSPLTSVFFCHGCVQKLCASSKRKIHGDFIFAVSNIYIHALRLKKERKKMTVASSITGSRHIFVDEKKTSLAIIWESRLIDAKYFFFSSPQKLFFLRLDDVLLQL